MDRFDVLQQRVIEFVNDGSQGLTDFVYRTAKEFCLDKPTVRAMINNYDPNPGSPQGRPLKEEPVVELDYNAEEDLVNVTE